jgi:hypothetical protein
MKRSCSHLIAIVTIADCVLIKGWLCLVEFQVWLGLFLGFCSLESKALLFSQCSFVYMVNLHGTRLC